MSTPPHSSSMLYRTRDMTYLDRVLGYDAGIAQRAQGVHEAIAYFLDEVAAPCILAGSRYGDMYFPTDVALTYDVNLFASSEWDNNWTKDQPVTVAVMPDGTVTDFTGSVDSEATSVLRFVISSPLNNCALDCAWMLHGLFRKRPVFQRVITVGHGTNSERSKVDLDVRDVRPIDEPQIADRSGSRVRVVFRVQSIHHRK